ncbi:MAG TPA: nucleotide-binding protein [Methanospirillum sp.]|nr:nucleotide-binding protein [Methanospirillum sp.]
MAADRNGYPDRVTVLIDTNAFLMTLQFRIDLLGEIRGMFGVTRPGVPDVVIRELQGLSMGRGNDAAAARFGLRLAEMCDVVETGGEGMSVDDRIFAYACRERCRVVTNDRALRERLLDEGLDVISMRGKQRLEIIRR